MLFAAVPAGPDARAAADPKAPPQPPCQVHPGLGDVLDYSCPLTVARPGQHLVFRAVFDGGHDDTMASLTARLDGVPIDCDAGSKTELMGEFGTVKLECRVTPAGTAGSVHVLDVSLAWSHAQYARYELAAD